MAAHAERSRPAILVVEDDPGTRQMLRLVLETDGFDVLEAADGRAALAAAESAAAALVILDLLLRDMDAFELLRRLRALPNGDNLPIVALSGSMRAVEEARTPLAGFTALCLKPVAPARLVEVVRGCLGGGAAAAVDDPATPEGGAEPDLEPPASEMALGQQCRIQAAQLAFLSGVIGALTRYVDREDRLPDVMAAAFADAAIAKGALLRRGLGGHWTVHQQAGFAAADDLSGFFGHLALLDMVVAGTAGVTIPSALVDDQVSADVLAGAQLASAHLEPLAAAQRREGVLLLGITATDESDRHSVFLAPPGPRVRQVLGFPRLVTGDSPSSGRRDVRST